VKSEDIIIADSGPLIGLAKIAHLSLLPKLANRVIVPKSVWIEATKTKSAAPDAALIRSQAWIEIVLAEREMFAALPTDVGLGEREAIALAQTLPIAVLLLDDFRARRLADSLGLRRMGTLALLAIAKRYGLIERVRPCADALIASGFYIRQEIVDSILADVGEL
jgi:uncharacterized protein